MTVRDKDIGKIKDLFASRARLPCTRPSASGHTLSFLDLWSRPRGVARLLALRGVDPRPYPQEWVG